MELSSLFLYKSIKIDKMEVIKTDIDGVLIIEPRLFRDARGYFFESFSEREFKEKVEPLVGYKVEFCQDNESMSSYGVMRGLHFQRPPFTQSKLVRCVKGRVLDVAVDIRKGSPTYGKHVAVELTEDNHRQFFILNRYGIYACAVEGRRQVYLRTGVLFPDFAASHQEGCYGNHQNFI